MRIEKNEFFFLIIWLFICHRCLHSSGARPDFMWENPNAASVVWSQKKITYKYWLMQSPSEGHRPGPASSQPGSRQTATSISHWFANVWQIKLSTWIPQTGDRPEQLRSQLTAAGIMTPSTDSVASVGPVVDADDAWEPPQSVGQGPRPTWTKSGTTPNGTRQSNGLEMTSVTYHGVISCSFGTQKLLDRFGIGHSAVRTHHVIDF